MPPIDALMSSKQQWGPRPRHHSNVCVCVRARACQSFVARRRSEPASRGHPGHRQHAERPDAIGTCSRSRAARPAPTLRVSGGGGVGGGRTRSGAARLVKAPDAIPPSPSPRPDPLPFRFPVSPFRPDFDGGRAPAATSHKAAPRRRCRNRAGLGGRSDPRRPRPGGCGAGGGESDGRGTCCGGVRRVMGQAARA